MNEHHTDVLCSSVGVLSRCRLVAGDNLASTSLLLLCNILLVIPLNHTRLCTLWSGTPGKLSSACIPAACSSMDVLLLSSFHAWGNTREHANAAAAAGGDDCTIYSS